MSVISLILFLIIAIYILRYWIALAFSWPLIRLMSKKRKKNFISEEISSEILAESLEQIQYEVPEEVPEESSLKNLEKNSKENSEENSEERSEGKGGCYKRLKNVFNGYMRYMDIKTGMLPSHAIRKFIFRHVFLVQIDEKAVLYYGSEIRGHSNLHIHVGAIVGDKSLLDARNGIEICEDANLSSNVSIYTEQHDYNDKYFRALSQTKSTRGIKKDASSSSHFDSPSQLDSSSELASTSDLGSTLLSVRIGKRAWIGPNVIILPGVKVGEGAVVGAGAVVTKDLEPYSVNVGIPARKIRERAKNLEYHFDGSFLPFY